MSSARFVSPLIRDDFPALRHIDEERGPLIYLDSSATTLKPQAVVDAVTRCYERQPSSVHRGVHAHGQDATAAYESVREALAHFLHADAQECVFTRNSTEAISMVQRCFPGLRRVATTEAEHHSNYLPWLEAETVHVIRITSDGRIDLEQLRSLLKSGVDLVAVSYVGSVLGTIQPVEEIIRMCHEAGSLVLLDATQAVPHLPVSVAALDVDFLVCSAHKMLAPTGAGLLYCKREHLARMQPWIRGSHAVESVNGRDVTWKTGPARLEPGTPAIEAVMGWGAAVRYLTRVGMNNIADHDRALVTHALAQLQQIPKLRIVGPTAARDRCSSVAFNIPGLEAHGVARMLSDRSNIVVRSGFHCAQPLHTSLNLRPTVRASFYLYNTHEDVDALTDNLRQIVRNA